jgi:EmrB/QacA subfamily drug resistance transporter
VETIDQPRRVDRLLLANAMLGQFITGFAARSFVVGLPTIAAALDADIVGVSWAIIAYQLAGISLSIVFGRLGDIHGRHAIYGAGFAIMAASAVLCGLSPSVWWLVTWRLAEGVGAAMLASATRVLALEAMPESSAGRAHGFMTMSFHGGVLLGPPAGGLVIDLLSWRWIFFLLVPIGVVGIVLTALTGKRSPSDPSARRPAIDYAGALLLIVLTVALTLLLDRRSADAIGAGRTGLLGAVFVAGLAWFVVHERQARNPVVNFALFRNRMFSFSVLSLLVVSTATSVMTLVLPFYMQDVLHHSASFMGLVFLAAPVFTITLAPIVGQLTDRIGARIPAAIGVTMTTAAVLVGTSLGRDSHWLWPAALMALAGIGQGFFNTSNQTALIGSVPRDYRGFATGMVQMVFGLGALLGTALGTVLLTVMFRYATGVPDAVPTAQQPVPFVFAMNATFAVCLALTATAFVSSLLRGAPGARPAPDR